MVSSVMRAAGPKEGASGTGRFFLFIGVFDSGNGYAQGRRTVPSCNETVWILSIFRKIKKIY